MRSLSSTSFGSTVASVECTTHEDGKQRHKEHTCKPCAHKHLLRDQIRRRPTEQHILLLGRLLALAATLLSATLSCLIRHGLLLLEELDVGTGVCDLVIVGGDESIWVGGLCGSALLGVGLSGGPSLAGRLLLVVDLSQAPP